jgi:hypothetical protein
LGVAKAPEQLTTLHVDYGNGIREATLGGGDEL